MMNPCDARGGRAITYEETDRNSRRWGEVFDPKKRTWDALLMPSPHCNFPSVCESIVIEEEKKVVAMSGLGRCLSYTPSENKMKKRFRDISGANRCWHVIENVVYCSRRGGLVLWCEPRELEWEVMEWREVTGLESLRKTLAASKLVNYGGCLWDHWEKCRIAMGLGRVEIDEIFPGHKLSNFGPNMLLFWDVLLPHKLEIWCTEISSNSIMYYPSSQALNQSQYCPNVCITQPSRLSFE